MSRERHRSTADWVWAGFANLAVVSPLLWAAGVLARSPTLYAAGVQEDGWLEWMTFWGFVLAAVAFLLAARRERQTRGGLPWFTLGLSLFCLLVALEEISWGQRLFGYRPPTYFLQHNFQQELNVHNLIDTSLRKLTLKGIMIGYGVVLPVLGAFAFTRRLLERVRIQAPPVTVVPGFVAAVVAYETYPWKYTGELVELMLAMAFLFAAFSSLRLHAPCHRDTRRTAWIGRPTFPLAAMMVVFLLGAASGWLTLKVHEAHPGNIQAARSETEALKRDLLALAEEGDLPTRCGLHRRVYTWVTRAGADYLYAGEFAALAAQGLPEERADYFIDPWNSPYWVRHRCTSSRERVTVYSFGPNRRRDSEPEELLGDDVGVVIDRPRVSDDSRQEDRQARHSGRRITSPG